MENQITIGTERGKTPYSETAEKPYNSFREDTNVLNAGEYYAVTQGYLREWVCMAQCNTNIQVATDPEIKKSIETYRHDVCEPNLTELKVLLEKGGYELPKEYNAETAGKSVEELENIDSGFITDEQLMIGHVFFVQAFMDLWNMGAIHSYRCDVREAFVRNYHRANRWHLAAIAMAEQKGFLPPLPEIKS